MKPRFEARENTPGSWGVFDTQAAQFYRMIDVAVTMYMRKSAAKKITSIMNTEWIYFLNHPS